MPVHANDTWVQSHITQSIKGDSGFFLDTYAVGVPSTVIGAQHMMDLKTDVMIKNPAGRLFAIASGLTIVLVALLGIGLLIPFIIETSARSTFNDLDVLEAEVTAFEANTRTQFEIDSLRADVEFIETRVGGIDDFYDEFAQASVVVPIIFQPSLTDQVSGFMGITEIEAERDVILITANSRSYEHLADIMEYFWYHELFRVAEAETNRNTVHESNTTDEVEGTTSFVVRLFQERKAGAIR
jgi:hypothetical protein